jgi:hypothetical protein
MCNPTHYAAFHAITTILFAAFLAGKNHSFSQKIACYWLKHDKYHTKTVYSVAVRNNYPPNYYFGRPGKNAFSRLCFNFLNAADFPLDLVRSVEDF